MECLECQIFVLKVLGYTYHFSPLSVTKPYTAKSGGCSHCSCSCSNLWRQFQTTHWSLLWKIEISHSDFLQTRWVDCSELTSQSHRYEQQWLRPSLFAVYGLCLVHIWLAMGIRSPYPARIPLSVRPPRGLPVEAAVRFLYGFTGSAASTIWLSEKFYKFEKIVSP